MDTNKDVVAVLSRLAIPYFDRGDREWLTIECPYHSDVHESIADCHGGIHRTSFAFKCFSCGTSSTLVQVAATKTGQPEFAVEAYINNNFKVNDIDPGFVALCHKELLCNVAVLGKLVSKHGITTEEIKKHNLGWHARAGRVTIPVYSTQNELINMRMYKYDADKDKLISFKKGKGNSLYLANNAIDNETVYLTEGEFKAILLTAKGFPACAGTGGAGYFNEDWIYFFKGKNVVIVYDVDKAGRNGANKVKVLLSRYTKSIKDIYLNQVADIPNGDITDYFTKAGGTADDFRKIVDATIPYEAAKLGINTTTESTDPAIELRLSQTGKAQYNLKNIKTVAVVSAKDTAPYIIPKSVAVNCSKSKDFCHHCPLFRQEGSPVIDIPPTASVILDLVGVPEATVKKNLKAYIGIHQSCKEHSFDIKESYNVEEIRLIPQIAIGHTTDEQITRKAYYVGAGLATNNTYEILGKVCAEPTDGHATLLVDKANPVSNDLDNYETKNDLTVFQPIEWTVESIKAKLDDIYEDFESNVTRIFERRNLHLFYDLCWHSVLYIPFQGRQIKGWADVLVIGDSGQGKSECSLRLSEHYKCGERVDTKRASVAGIVGGLQETQGRWFVTWGTIPLNDRRLVLLEEVKGMGASELTKLTDMRSSGVAEIHKIERARTMARTRLVWISNPRSDNKISTYNFGVYAVKELIGSLEDIRRFDMVMAVASGEVDSTVINGARRAEATHSYTSELCQDLVGWCWSRSEKNIHIEADAEKAILDSANSMGATYSSSIPIVEPGDQRLKIARLSAALAGRTYSCSDDGQTMIVRKCHVEYVVAFLHSIYKSKALGYYDYSVAQSGEDVLKDAGEVALLVKSAPMAADLAQALIEMDFIRTEDIQNYTEWQQDRADEFIGALARQGALKRKKAGYKKSSAFIELLKKLDREGSLGSMTYKAKMMAGEL